MYNDWLLGASRSALRWVKVEFGFSGKNLEDAVVLATSALVSIESNGTLGCDSATAIVT